MKFSDKTILILKNFATISQSIAFVPGNTLRTINPKKTIMGSAGIEETIPAAACIYDLSKFLSAYGLYDNPEITFQEKNIIISEGKRKTVYTVADPSMVVMPPEKDITLPSIDVEVNIGWQDLQSVIRASGVLRLPEIAFIGDGSKCYIKAINVSDPTADSYGVELTETPYVFKMIIKAENIKLMPMDYAVSLSSRGICRFQGQDATYFIALEANSTFKGE